MNEGEGEVGDTDTARLSPWCRNTAWILLSKVLCTSSVSGDIINNWASDLLTTRINYEINKLNKILNKLTT